MVHASTGTAADNPCCHRSYTPSTRRHGVSLRQNVSCCVFLPVVERATFGARPGSDLKRQALGNKVAVRAAFAARKESVHEPELLSIPGALVGEHLAEGVHADIRNGPGELPVEHHIPHAQVLQTKDIEAPDERRGHLRKVVLPAIGDLTVQLGNFEPLPMPAAASLPSSGKGPLVPSQLGKLRGQEPRIGDALSIGKRRHMGNTEIYPHALASLGKRLHVFIQAKGHEVLPSTVLCYRNRAGLTRELPGPADAQVPHLGQTQVVLLPIPRERGAGELGRLLPVLRLEAGKCRPLLKEAAEGGLQVPESLLKWNAGNLTKPEVVGLFFPSGKGCAQLPVTGRGLVCSETIISKPKCLVVNEAHTTKRLG